MEKETTADSNFRIEKLHSNCIKWISDIHFVKDEVLFIKNLLNSDVFNGGTPNLYERLQMYLGRLTVFEEEVDSLKSELLLSEDQLGRCVENGIDMEADALGNKLSGLGSRVEEIIAKFQMIKTEIFHYCGGNFRKRR